MVGTLANLLQRNKVTDNNDHALKLLACIGALNKRLDIVSAQLTLETIRVDAEIARLKQEFRNYGEHKP